MAAVSQFVIGKATAAQRETVFSSGQQDDLDASIPGTGIALGGDGATAYPSINIPGMYEGPNPLVMPDDRRPLPTGTAVGPNGEHYGLYSIVPYSSTGYTSSDTTVVDLSNPSATLGTLSGVSQASAAYDESTKRMVIIGNTTSGRAMWTSYPTNWPCFRSWWKTLDSPKYFTGALQGNRENQIAALPGGGFLLVAAADYQPIVAAAATTTSALLTTTATTLLSNTSFPGGMYPYGPTIVDLQQSSSGIAVTLRVSTFGVGGYDPHTYLTQFIIAQI